MAARPPTPENQAAFLMDKTGKPLEVRPAPYPRPGPGELVVRNEAVALNPVDAGIQQAGGLITPWLQYPCVIGTDVSGVVVEVGPEGDDDNDDDERSADAPAAAHGKHGSGGGGGCSFKPGDRVLGLALGTDRRARRPEAEGAFQRYTVLRASLAARIPAALPCAQAAVLPLAASTAATGLFMADQLGLSTARLGMSSEEETGISENKSNEEGGDAAEQEQQQREVVVVWGASTSVGLNAVQLARAAGYAVLATASTKNSDYVRGLGAEQVYDYRSPYAPETGAVSRIREALRGRPCAGALAIGSGSLEACLEIVGRQPETTTMTAPPSSEGGGRKRRFVAQASAGIDGVPVGVVGLMRAVVQMGLWKARTAWRAWRLGVDFKFIWGSDLMETGLGRLVFNEFLPRALADGTYRAEPRTEVVGRGLESIQGGIERVDKGMSTAKAVVVLGD